MDQLLPSILWGWVIWRFLYLRHHHKMPWVRSKKDITLKRKPRDWEK